MILKRDLLRFLCSKGYVIYKVYAKGDYLCKPEDLLRFGEKEVKVGATILRVSTHNIQLKIAREGHNNFKAVKTKCLSTLHIIDGSLEGFI
jgi:hypothetical protein